MTAASGEILSEIERETMRRVTMRLMPLLMLGFLVAFIDRVNVGFAALQMNADAGLSSSVFGLGAGLFFVAYFLFEVPSNLMLERFGARLWLARIMITWGLISAATALVIGPLSFCTVRFLLGAAEAGFYPGVIFYLTRWFPKAYRARVIALFAVAVPLSNFVGSPISATLLGLDGWLGLRGWQLMSILEAAPAVVLGLLVLRFLPDGPDRAPWLDAAQRGWLTGRLEAERAEQPLVRPSVWRVILDRRVLAAGLIFAGSVGASACLSIWQPQIFKSYGLTTMEIGLLNSVPFGVAAGLMVLWARRSDRTGERAWHVAGPQALTALCLAAALAAQGFGPTVAILFLAILGTYAVKGQFWAMVTEWLPPGASAAGIAQINAIGNLGAFVGTYLMGVIKDASGSYALGLLPLALVTAMGAALALGLGRTRAPLSPVLPGERA